MAHGKRRVENYNEILGERQLRPLLRRRIEDEIAGIRSEGFCLEPAGPSQAPGFTEADFRHLLFLKHQLYVPKEMVPAIV